MQITSLNAIFKDVKCFKIDTIATYSIYNAADIKIMQTYGKLTKSTLIKFSKITAQNAVIQQYNSKKTAFCHQRRGSLMAKGCFFTVVLLYYCCLCNKLQPPCVRALFHCLCVMCIPLLDVFVEIHRVQKCHRQLV